MRVFAYLDPGSGSMILQALLGGFAAVMVSIKMFGKRVFRTLTFWRDHDEDESPTATVSTTSAEQHDSAEQHETEKEPV
jgi:hypothetical protein